MNAIKIVKWVFSISGAGMLIGAFFAYSSTRDFLVDATTAQGKVIYLERSRSSDSTTYRPVVEFRAEDGRRIEFTSSMGSNPPSYSRGEAVEVLYLRDQPERAKINGFFSLWGLPIILGSMGAIFFLVGFGIFWVGHRRAATIQHLKNYGMPILATFQSVERNGSLRVNGRSPYQILAQWTNPMTNELHVFKSDNLWFDPSTHIDREQISILIDDKNPKKYYMDVSFLPRLAE